MKGNCMKIIKLCITIILLINSSLLLSFSTIRLLPVTFKDGIWYGLFCHEKTIENINQGWNSFNITIDERLKLNWVVLIEDMLLKKLTEQTNEMIQLDEEYLQKFSVKLGYSSNIYDEIYFVYLKIPETLLHWHQDKLTIKAYKTPNATMDGYMWAPLEKIIQGKKIESSLPADASGQEMALMIKNFTLTKALQQILENYWQEARKKLSEKLNIAQTNLTILLTELEQKLDTLKKVILKQTPSAQSAQEESSYKKFIKFLGYEEW